MVAASEMAPSVPDAKLSAGAAATQTPSCKNQPWWYRLLVPSDSGTVATLGAYATEEQLSEVMKSTTIATAAATEKDSSLMQHHKPWWHQLLVPSYTGTVATLGYYAETEQLPPDMVEYINACEALRQKLEQSSDNSLPLWYQLLVPSYSGTVTSLGSWAETSQLPPDLIEYIKSCEALRQKLEQSGDNSLPLWYQLLVPSYSGTVTSLGSWAETEQLPPDLIEYIKSCEALRQKLEESGHMSLWYQLLVPSYAGTITTLGSYADVEQLPEDIKKWIKMCEEIQKKIELVSAAAKLGEPVPLWYRLLVPSYQGTVATLESYADTEQLPAEIIEWMKRREEMYNKLAKQKGKTVDDLTLDDFNEFLEGTLHSSNPFNQVSIDCRHLHQMQQQRQQQRIEEGKEDEEGTEVGEGSEIDEASEVEQGIEAEKGTEVGEVTEADEGTEAEEHKDEQDLTAI